MGTEVNCKTESISIRKVNKADTELYCRTIIKTRSPYPTILILPYGISKSGYSTLLKAWGVFFSTPRLFK